MNQIGRMGWKIGAGQTLGSFPEMGTPQSQILADAPVTADVLGKLHLSNQKEIEMGKQAQTNGQRKDVKAFGKTLVKDHSAADKKVAALAKKEKIDLAAATPSAKDDTPVPAAGPDFDGKFGQISAR
jgi:predicted outer membrane protein